MLLFPANGVGTTFLVDLNTMPLSVGPPSVYFAQGKFLQNLESSVNWNTWTSVETSLAVSKTMALYHYIFRVALYIKHCVRENKHNLLSPNVEYVVRLSVTTRTHVSDYIYSALRLQSPPGRSDPRIERSSDSLNWVSGYRACQYISTTDLG